VSATTGSNGTDDWGWRQAERVLTFSLYHADMSQRDMPFCSSCGAELVEDAAYCHRCGKPVREVKSEQFTLDSDKLVQKLKELVNEGNVTRIMVRDDKGNLLLDLPLTVGVVGIVLAPLLAAAGAIAAVVTKCTVTIERKA
jgi:hypothetical protein